MHSSSSRRKEKVAWVTRNANPSGWISDEEIRGKFLYWRVIKYVVPHKYLALQLFKKEWFLFQEWIAYKGLTDFVKMKGHCYLDLVEILTVGSTPTPAVDHTTFIPQIDFAKYVLDQFRKKSERDERVEDNLLRWEKKGNKNCTYFETEDFDDESIDED
ncbi:hypothetical protein LR48_Vigan02g127400 [Vigna angularis]|uniref:Uncharacterized protein n=1 Tax=Phaseolus angularis TaxID=3914 RepID=A0A0L9TY60_PHAAN|nr:hypothetical protein LR48_Vigan02g127400 [Vigna angularis]